MITVNTPVDVPWDAVAAFAQPDGTWIVYEKDDPLPPELIAEDQ